MATRANHASNSFLNAAQKVLDDKAAAQKTADMRARREATMEQRRLREYQKKLHAAFGDYRETVAPIIAALDAVKDRDGKTFMIWVEQGMHTDWASQQEKRDLRINAIYTSPATEADKPSDVHRLSVNVAADTRGRNLSPKLSERPALRIILSHDTLTGEKIIAETYREEKRWYEPRQGHTYPKPKGYFQNTEVRQSHEVLKSVADIPAFIGKWLAEAAPERVNDVRKVMGVKPKTARKQPAPR